jgi:hypothetical protein
MVLVQISTTSTANPPNSLFSLIQVEISPDNTRDEESFDFLLIFIMFSAPTAITYQIMVHNGYGVLDALGVIAWVKKVLGIRTQYEDDDREEVIPPTNSDAPGGGGGGGGGDGGDVEMSKMKEDKVNFNPLNTPQKEPSVASDTLRDVPVTKGAPAATEHDDNVFGDLALQTLEATADKEVTI